MFVHNFIKLLCTSKCCRTSDQRPLVFCFFFLPICDLTVAGLRRSFRLSRKDRQGSSGEGSDPGEPEFLTYEEVTRYQQRPNERPRLVVLIGKTEKHKWTPVMMATSSGLQLVLQHAVLLFTCIFTICFRKVLLEQELMNSNRG